MLLANLPGVAESNTGYPLSGKSKTIVNKLLKKISLTRQDVYSTYLVKCANINNANLTYKEIDKCSPYLLEQINIVKPFIILALGVNSISYLSKTIKRQDINIEGNGNAYLFIPDKESLIKHKFYVVPTFNPAIQNKEMDQCILEASITVKTLLKIGKEIS